MAGGCSLPSTRHISLNRSPLFIPYEREIPGREICSGLALASIAWNNQTIGVSRLPRRGGETSRSTRDRPTWGFSRIFAQLWQGFSHKPMNRVLQRSVAKDHLLAAFLTNCYMCLYQSSPTGEYLGLSPPTRGLPKIVKIFNHHTYFFWTVSLRSFTRLQRGFVFSPRERALLRISSVRLLSSIFFLAIASFSACRVRINLR